MTSEGLEAAIVQPAKRLKYHVQDRLLAEMLHDVETEANSLPLLQFALQQLWEQQNREQRELTHAAYQQLGGVAGALNQKADTIYHQLEAAGHGDWVRRVLLKLVRTGEGTKDTRQRRPKAELLNMGTNTATCQTIASVVTALVDGRLLVSDRVNDQDVIDLSHEALIQRWQRLATWREQDRDLRRLVDRIEDAQRDWLQQGKKRQDLLQGRLLRDARRLLKQQAEAVAGTKAFIQKSLHWRWTQLTATLLVPALILGIPTEYFWREESVKRDYDRIDRLSNRDQGERAAVLNLAGGCWATAQYGSVPAYFRERIFGNCRSLESAKLDKANLNHINLSGANLRVANLSATNLSSANLSGADLRVANLSGADLSVADLSNANLNAANLDGSDLVWADLRSANLSATNLRSANLSGTDLSNSDLHGTNLRGINFRSINLSGAYLGGTDLSNAILNGANLANANFGCYDILITTGVLARRECSNLKDIKWDERTNWQGIKGWAQVEKIPPVLKRQLRLR